MARSCTSVVRDLAAPPGADKPLLRGLGIIEVDPAELAATGHLAKRLNSHAGLIEFQQQVRDASLPGQIRSVLASRNMWVL